MDKRKEEKTDLDEFMKVTSQLARMGSWKLLIQDRILSLSDITCQVIGAPDNFIPDIDKLTSLIKGDDKNKFLNVLKESETKSRPFDMVMRMNSLTGNNLVVRIIGSPLMVNGKCSEISGFIQDITEKVMAEEEVIRRENMLRAIASATEELLSNPNYMDAVAKSLPVLGKAVNVDRVYFFKTAIDNNKYTASQIFEWNSGVSGPQIDNPELQNLRLDKMESFLDDIFGKRSFSSITSTLPSGSQLRVLLESQDIRSELVIPVFLEDSLWGYVGYDECKYDRIWTDGEISILKSFCSSISIAIERSDSHLMLEKLSKVARSNRLGVYFTDPEMRIIYVNESLLNLTGYTMDEVLGKMPDELFHGPLTQLDNKELLHRSYKEEGAVDVDIILYRKDKTWFWANLKKQLLDTNSSERSDFFSIVEDISEKKFAEEDLRNSQIRLSSLIMNLKEGILLEDESRKIVFVNRHFCNMFKIKADPSELEGSDCIQVIKNGSQIFVSPENFINRTDKIIAGNTIILEEELELVNRHIFERDYIPIIIDNETRGHLWKYKDVTANKNQVLLLKQQEEKYRNIITNMRMGLVETDVNDIIISVNQQLCDMTGYSKEELIGNEYVDLLVENSFKEKVREKRKLRKEGVSDIYQTQVRLKNGNKRWWLTSGGPNYNDSGAIIGTVGISIDLTDQKTLELELEIAWRKAEESSRAKEAFLANMSHEMRTPLNVIIGMIREISRESLSPSQNQYIRNAVMASNHLLSLVNNVLDIAKIESGLMKLDLHTFSLGDVINDTLTVLTPMAKEKQLVIRTDISPMLSSAYIGDPIRLRQILINIVNNAIKFTEKGFISISCSVDNVKDNLHQISITVSDTGIGMNELYLAKIFEKFSQSDLSSARKYGGTGLGMAITRELIQMMNGKISVKSKIGEGTEVKIEIELPAGKIMEMEVMPDPENFENIKNKKILLVEDNEMNRLVARNSLSFYGVDVTEAANGKAAIEILKELSFDLILMDLHMPGMGGLEATVIIRRELGLNTPIIALTANSIKVELDRCIQVGMNDYLIKPFEENALLTVIHRYIQPVIPNDENEKANVMNDKIYSLDLIMELSRGNMDFVRKMVSVFCEQTPEAVENIISAYNANDLETVSKVAHRIKPNLANFGIVSLAEDIKDIESLALNGTATPVLEEKIRRLETVVNLAVKQLNDDNV